MFTPKITFPALEINDDEQFKEAVNKIDDIFASDVQGIDKKLIIYKRIKK